MLDLKPPGLHDQITASLKSRNSILDSAYKASKIFSGEGLRSLENHPQSFISQVMPGLVFNNPRVVAEAHGPPGTELLAQEQQVALNQWVRTINYANELEAVALDYLYSWGVVKTVMNNAPGYDDDREFVPQLPVPYYVPDYRFFMDHLADKPSRARFSGDCDFIDLDDLTADPNTNKKVVQSIKPDRSPEKDLYRYFGRRADDDRRDVLICEIWVPEVRLSGSELPKWWTGPDPDPSRGYNGTIYTMAYGHTGGWVKDPYPYYGPPWGPYTLFGAYRMRGCAYPIGPLALLADQMVADNELANVNYQSSKSYKRFMAMRSHDTAKKVKSISHDGIMVDPDFDAGMSGQFEVNGVTDQMIANKAVMSEMVQKGLGISSSRRGFTQKGVTATAESIADQGFGRQTSWIESRFLNGVSQSLKTAGWLIHHSPDVLLGVKGGLFIGGNDLDQMLGLADMLGPDVLEDIQNRVESGTVTGPSENWYNISIDVDMYSMGYTDRAQEQRRAIELINAVTSLAPAIKDNPHVAWVDLLDILGRRMNDNDLGRVVNVQLANQIFALNMAMGVNDAASANDRLNQKGIRASESMTAVPGYQSGAELGARNRTES